MTVGLIVFVVLNALWGWFVFRAGVGKGFKAGIYFTEHAPRLTASAIIASVQQAQEPDAERLAEVDRMIAESFRKGW